MSMCLSKARSLPSCRALGRVLPAGALSGDQGGHEAAGDPWRDHAHCHLVQSDGVGQSCRGEGPGCFAEGGVGRGQMGLEGWVLIPGRVAQLPREGCGEEKVCKKLCHEEAAILGQRGRVRSWPCALGFTPAPLCGRLPQGNGGLCSPEMLCLVPLSLQGGCCTPGTWQWDCTGPPGSLGGGSRPSPCSHGALLHPGRL